VSSKISKVSLISLENVFTISFQSFSQHENTIVSHQKMCAVVQFGEINVWKKCMLKSRKTSWQLMRNCAVCHCIRNQKKTHSCDLNACTWLSMKILCLQLFGIEANFFPSFGNKRSTVNFSFSIPAKCKQKFKNK
jgi:hypothetical protein